MKYLKNLLTSIGISIFLIVFTPLSALKILIKGIIGKNGDIIAFKKTYDQVDNKPKLNVTVSA